MLRVTLKARLYLKVLPLCGNVLFPLCFAQRFGSGPPLADLKEHAAFTFHFHLAQNKMDCNASQVEATC